MNYKMICRTVGNIVTLEGALMLLPALCALCYAEWTVALVFVCAAAAASGMPITPRESASGVITPSKPGR